MKPLTDLQIEEQSQRLVRSALVGNKNSLNDLIRLHQPFIFNVAWKFTNSSEEEVKDLTQEVLVKIITKLSSFKGNSSFRTWAYRIVFNQFLQTRRRSMEDRWESLYAFATELNFIPSPELFADEEMEQVFRIKTARTRCMSGMLMCLTGEQRLLYLVGEVFRIDHNTGAEIFNLSKANYRVKLSRTRKEFHAFMNKQCGLVNLDNPCRCSKKAKAMEAAGKMQVNKQLFDPEYYSTITKFASEVGDEVADAVDRKYIEFFQKHPFKSNFDADTVLDEIVNDPELNKYFN